ncbi:MAG TPA: hypothetical protein VH478_12495 [Trebonia sp.]|jgi:hypothetical protein|nr:hypothetical protein [Trebonia sp.]
MIPGLVTVGYRHAGGRWRRVHVPVVPAALVLSPLLALAVLGGLVACAVSGISPLGALRGAGRLAWALPGARLEIGDGETGLLFSAR